MYNTDENQEIDVENEEIWDEDDFSVMDDLEPDRICSNDLRPRTGQPQASCLVNWIIAFFSFLQAAYQLSDMVASLWIQFLNILFSILGRFCSICRDISEALPTSLYAMRKLNGSADLRFRRYVVCRKCHQISHCLQGNQSKRCTYRAFPRHPHSNMRQQCNTLLLKTVELASGKVILYPFMTYCYLSLASSLEKLLERPSSASYCEEWRSYNSDTGIMKDIYDGKIWKEFQNFNGTLDHFHLD